MVDVSDLLKTEVLAALYNAARPQGMGFMHYKPEPMTIAAASEELSYIKGSYFDYVLGRVIKVDFKDWPMLDDDLYDRDNGEGCMRLVIDSLRKTKDTNNAVIRAIHAGGVEDGIKLTKVMMDQETQSTETEIKDGPVTLKIPTARIGLAEFADMLGAKIKKIEDK